MRIAVLNGTTRTGLARSIGDRLERHGATIEAIDSAPDQSTTQTSIRYYAGRGGAAHEVADVLGRGRVEPYDGHPRTSSSATIVVVAGFDLGGP